MTELGFLSQIGVAEEATYGTAETVNRFYEFTTEGLDHEVQRLESRAIRAASFQKKAKNGQRVISGDIAGELPTVGFGLWLKHLVGAPVITQPDDTGAPSVYDQTFTPGEVDGLGLTVQIARGATHTFTYSGVKVDQLQIGARVGEICTFTAGLVGQDAVTNISKETASYDAALDCFTFLDASLTLEGTELEVQQVDLTIANTLKSDRWKLGSDITREPLRNGYRLATGSFEVNFEDLSLYNTYLAGTLGTLVTKFEGPVIEGGFSSTLEITQEVQLNGSTPRVGGPEEIMQTVPFKSYLVTGDADALTMLYRSTDAAS